MLITSCRKTDAIMNFNYGNLNIADKKAKELCIEGMNQIQVENFEEAKAALEKANAIEQNNVIIMNALANTVNILGETNKAESLYKNSLKIDENFMPTYVNYGNLLNEQKRFDESESILLKGLAKEPITRYKEGLYFNLSLIMKKQGKCSEARNYANLALENCEPEDSHRNEIKIFISEINTSCEENSH